VTLETALGPDAKVDLVCDRLRTASWAYLEAHGIVAPPGGPDPPPAGTPSLQWFQHVLPRDDKLLGNALVLQDGLLTADRITRQNLSGLALVVLGACDSGLGVIAAGEGIIGLQRAFHQAGVRDVVASLWKVNPSSARRLMTNLYRAVLHGPASVPEALQRAQLEMIRKPVLDEDEPFFWAAWVVSGDPRPVGVPALAARRPPAR
jgi:hypothetical protein